MKVLLAALFMGALLAALVGLRRPVKWPAPVPVPDSPARRAYAALLLIALAPIAASLLFDLSWGRWLSPFVLLVALLAPIGSILAVLFPRWVARIWTRQEERRASPEEAA